MFDLDIDKLKTILIEQHENDEKQLEVIFSEAPRVIVEAPAGYGKTTTMISRIAYLYTAGKIPNPKRILALTFSVNAALKIKRDIAEKLPRLIGEKNNPTAINEKVTATNYHGFCKGILQKHGYLISSILRKDVNSFKAFGDSDVSRNLELKSVLDVKEMSVLTGMEETIKSGTVPTDDKVNEYNALVIEKLLPLNIITHNAVILFTIKLLESYPQISTFYQNYYPLLIIDEFQDTNCIAWKLICNLISTNTQLLFLGDPLQRIYGFIGALPDIMTIAANRLIRQDNQFIDDIVKTIEYLVKTIALAVGAIADALEVARVELICLKYRERRLNIAHTTGKYYHEYDKERLKAYHALTEQIEQKTSERNEALKESKRFFLKADRRAELTKSISKLTNELEDLESRRNMLLEYLKCKSSSDIPQAEARIKEAEENLPKIQAEWDKTDEALDEAIAEYGKLKAKASDFDKIELDQARKSLRADKDSEARKKIQEEHGHCDEHDFTDSVIYIDKRIGEYDEPPQKEAEVKPVYEVPPQETQERKSPSKSKRERDIGDR